MLTLANAARMRQIETAARLLTASWIASVIGWRLIDPPLLYGAYAAVDFALAVIFFQMMRGRLFPAPLFVLHVAMLCHHASAAMIHLPLAWMGVALNRMFELALIYVGGCAVYRMTSRGDLDGAGSFAKSRGRLS